MTAIEPDYVRKIESMNEQMRRALVHFIRAYHANDRQWMEAAYKAACKATSSVSSNAMTTKEKP